MTVLEAEHISKRFGKKTVLNGVSCAFEPGITALLGPNGAGKSTLMNILCTLLPADSGTVYYRGRDVRRQTACYLEKISVQFQSQPMYRGYTVREYLAFCGSLKGMRRSDIREQSGRLLDVFGLSDSAKKAVSALSGGMRQRLALCGTFLGEPEIVFLDEPSVGLDIYEREELKQFLCEWRTRGVVIVSTHIVSDVENIADQILLLRHGEIGARGAQQELIDQVEGKIWELPPRTTCPGAYHVDGRTLWFGEQPPCAGASVKCADLTDVYFTVCGRKEETVTVV